MEKKTSDNGIYQSLAAIQFKLNVPKTGYNNFGKYKYRSAEDILASLKPLLADQNCALTITDKTEMVGNRIYIVSTATLFNQNGDSISTTAMAREEDDKKGMDASQITGAASSYARKYALNGLFAIDDTADADKLNTPSDYTAKPAPQIATKQATKQLDEMPIEAQIELARKVANSSTPEQLQKWMNEAKEKYIVPQSIADAANDRWKILKGQRHGNYIHSQVFTIR